MSEPKTYPGRCFCGAVQITVTGDPIAMGYCHCESCRHWSAGPINAFTLWKPEAVKVIQGAEHLGSYNKSGNSERKWCKKCGGHVYCEHPSAGFLDVFAATIPDFPYKPHVHINYGERVLDIKDGLPKLKDFPKEMGGSGEVMPE
jgi:hypothetical protein